MRSTAVASGTHPQTPHCHTPCKPNPPSSIHATFPSQSKMLPFHLSTSASSSFQPLTSKEHNLIWPHTQVIHFIIDNFGFSCIFFLHSSLTFLQATLSNIYTFHIASDNSLITPPLTSCHPNLSAHLPMLLIQLPFSHSTAWDTTFLSSLSSYTLLVNTLYQNFTHLTLASHTTGRDSISHH